MYSKFSKQLLLSTLSTFIKDKNNNHKSLLANSLKQATCYLNSNNPSFKLYSSIQNSGIKMDGSNKFGDSLVEEQNQDKNLSNTITTTGDNNFTTITNVSHSNPHSTTTNMTITSTTKTTPTITNSNENLNSNLRQRQQQPTNTKKDLQNDRNQVHHHHPNLTIRNITNSTTTTIASNAITRNQQPLANHQNQPNDKKQMNNNNINQQNTIIASVERPSPIKPATRITSPISTNIKQQFSNNSPASERSASELQAAATTNAVIISQLQQLQSPPPLPTVTRESPLTQVTKSRHRGFLSQLLCCFKPTSSNIYHDSNSIYNDTEVSQHHNSFTQKYSGKYLLPARKSSDNRICLVIDLDETLVHSSFKPIENADFIVPVEIDGTLHKVYVLKRPHVDEFLKRMGQIFECVLFTASLAKYADPVADLLDTENIFKARLFRESCAFYRGNYVKDLSRLGRDLNRVIIVDNSPASYIFHPDNAVSFENISNVIQSNISHKDKSNITNK